MRKNNFYLLTGVILLIVSIWTCNKKVDNWLSCDNLFV